ncbi:MAG TPA: hypothetical protein VF764_03965, partial [Steroidobacteraceae bacterium]
MNPLNRLRREAAAPYPRRNIGDRRPWQAGELQARGVGRASQGPECAGDDRSGRRFDVTIGAQQDD